MAYVCEDIFVQDIVHCPLCALPMQQLTTWINRFCQIMHLPPFSSGLYTISGGRCLKMVVCLQSKKTNRKLLGQVIIAEEIKNSTKSLDDRLISMIQRQWSYPSK